MQKQIQTKCFFVVADAVHGWYLLEEKLPATSCCRKTIRLDETIRLIWTLWHLICWPRIEKKTIKLDVHYDPWYWLNIFSPCGFSYTFFAIMHSDLLTRYFSISIVVQFPNANNLVCIMYLQWCSYLSLWFELGINIHSIVAQGLHFSLMFGKIRYTITWERGSLV